MAGSPPRRRLRFGGDIDEEEPKAAEPKAAEPSATAQLEKGKAAAIAIFKRLVRESDDISFSDEGHEEGSISIIRLGKATNNLWISVSATSMHGGDGGSTLDGNFSLLTNDEDTDLVWLEDSRSGAVEVLRRAAGKPVELQAGGFGPEASAWMQQGGEHALTHIALIDPEADVGWLGLIKTKPKSLPGRSLLSSGQSFFRRVEQQARARLSGDNKGGVGGVSRSGRQTIKKMVSVHTEERDQDGGGEGSVSGQSQSRRFGHSQSRSGRQSMTMRALPSIKNRIHFEPNLEGGGEDAIQAGDSTMMLSGKAEQITALYGVRSLAGVGGASMAGGRSMKKLESIAASRRQRDNYGGEHGGFRSLAGVGGASMAGGRSMKKLESIAASRRQRDNYGGEHGGETASSSDASGAQPRRSVQRQETYSLHQDDRRLHGHHSRQIHHDPAASGSPYFPPDPAAKLPGGDLGLRAGSSLIKGPGSVFLSSSTAARETSGTRSAPPSIMASSAAAVATGGKLPMLSRMSGGSSVTPAPSAIGGGGAAAVLAAAGMKKMSVREMIAARASAHLVGH